MSFLGMGTTEILVIALIAFILLGPQRMIEMAKMAGKASREIRKTIDELPSLDLDLYSTSDGAPPKETNTVASPVITPPQPTTTGPTTGAAAAVAVEPTAAKDIVEADGPVAFQPAAAPAPAALSDQARGGPQKAS